MTNTNASSDMMVGQVLEKLQPNVNQVGPNYHSWQYQRIRPKGTSWAGTLHIEMKNPWKTAVTTRRPNQRQRYMTWKVNPSIRFKYLARFCNSHTSALYKDNKMCTLGMFQRFSIPYCKNISRKADKQNTHMVDILDKVIKNTYQVQAVSEVNKRN